VPDRPEAGAIPYWRLSGFYGFYYCIVGALIPFLSLYLQSLNYSAEEIGYIFAIFMLTKVIAPNLWSLLGDHLGKRLFMIRFGCLCAFISFAAVFVDTRFQWLAWVVGVYTFFWNAVLPQFEALALDHLGGRPERYSQIRVWGSLGFVVVAIILGYVFDQISIAYLPHLVLAFTLLMFVSSLSVGEAPHREVVHNTSGFRQILKRPSVFYFLLACFLLQVSHGPYYTFYSVYLESYSYSRAAIGWLWALGAIAEIGIFLIMHRLLPKFGLATLFLASLAITTLRWFLLACFPDSMALIIFIQLLHAFSFGVTHAVAIEVIRQNFSGRHQGQGQALYLAVSFGAGGAVGALAAGQMWDASPVLTFAFAAIAAALALVFAWAGERGTIQAQTSQ